MNKNKIVFTFATAEVNFIGQIFIKITELLTGKLKLKKLYDEYLSENIMARLRSKYSDQQLLDQIQETYMEITREQKRKAKKFAKKVLQKYDIHFLEKSFTKI